MYIYIFVSKYYDSFEFENASRLLPQYENRLKSFREIRNREFY